MKCYVKSNELLTFAIVLHILAAVQSLSECTDCVSVMEKCFTLMGFSEFGIKHTNGAFFQILIQCFGEFVLRWCALY